MKVKIYFPEAAACLMFGLLSATGLTHGATPSAEQALQLSPIQKNVNYSQPTPERAAKCKIRAEKKDGGAGWVVEDSSGVTLRRFFDTDGDNVVDRWAYFKDGLEVYRDIDSNYNGKADQYRWFHTQGSRWGVDRNEDGRVDEWKAISAEETTAEVVAALAAGDTKQFERVALTQAELDSLGLGEEAEKELAEKIDGLAGRFRQLVEQQKKVAPETKWLQFSGNRPGIVPKGTRGCTKDLRVYENVVAIVQTGGEHGQVQIGTLVEVGPVWKVIDLPVLGTPEEMAATGFFFQSPLADQQSVAAGTPGEEAQQLLTELEKLDAAASRAAGPQELATFNAKRADLLEQIAEAAGASEDRAMWIRQLADTVSAAVQSGSYPEGARRLESLFKKLQKNAQDQKLAAYVKFRQLMADYGLSIQAPKADFAKIQTDWLKKLEDYVSEYPKSPDTAEAMLQLAIAQEFAGQEDEAEKWYGRIVSGFSSSSAAQKAAGAQKRLNAVGKTLEFRGNSPSGGAVDLANHRGKVVLIHYWATWCEPCKKDMATIQEILTKYGRSGFAVIGVNLDTTSEEMADYVRKNRISWPQIHEEGGLESRPANDLGILTLPAMLLIDQQGRVVDRNLQVGELERELKRLIR